MDVLQAVRWAIQAWFHDVTEATIRNCWVKARVVAPKIGPQTRQEAERDGWREQLISDEGRLDAAISQMNTSIARLEETGCIKQAISIETWLNPITEVQLSECPRPLLA